MNTENTTASRFSAAAATDQGNAETVQTSNPSADQAPTITVPEGCRLVEFTFRLIKATATKRFQDSKEAFDLHGVPYELTRDPELPDKITGIRRLPVKTVVPCYTVDDFMDANPAFLQTLIDGVIEDEARSKFIDKYENEVNLDLFTVNDIIDSATASRRASGLPAELVESVCKFVTNTLKNHGTKPGTVTTIGDMIQNKFNKKVLTKYRAHESKFEGIFRTVELCYVAERDAEGNPVEYIDLFDAHLAALQHFQENIVNYFKELEAAQESDELDLAL